MIRRWAVALDDVSATGSGCDPALEDHYFDAAVSRDADSLSVPPCPSGYTTKGEPPTGWGLSTSGPAVRYATEAELVAAWCVVADAGEAPARVVDFATSAVVLVVQGTGPLPPLLARGDELWVRRSASPCGGAQPMPEPGFYVVPKDVELKVQTCFSTCSGLEP